MRLTENQISSNNFHCKHFYSTKLGQNMSYLGVNILCDNFSLALSPFFFFCLFYRSDFANYRPKCMLLKDLLSKFLIIFCIFRWNYISIKSMSHLVSKKDKGGFQCIIHCRKNISSKVLQFNQCTWEVAQRAAEIRGDEICEKGMHGMIFL